MYKNYPNIKWLVTSLYERDVQKCRFTYPDLIRNDGWLFMVALFPWLRHILLELFAQGVKELEKTRPGCIHQLLDRIDSIDSRNLPDDVRDSLTMSLFEADKIMNVTLDNIRKVLFSNPAQAKLYNRLALSSTENVRTSLSYALTSVKDEI